MGCNPPSRNKTNKQTNVNLRSGHRHRTGPARTETQLLSCSRHVPLLPRAAITYTGIEYSVTNIPCIATAADSETQPKHRIGGAADPWRRWKGLNLGKWGFRGATPRIEGYHIQGRLSDGLARVYLLFFWWYLCFLEPWLFRVSNIFSPVSAPFMRRPPRSLLNNSRELLSNLVQSAGNGVPLDLIPRYDTVSPLANLTSPKLAGFCDVQKFIILQTWGSEKLRVRFKNLCHEMMVHSAAYAQREPAATTAHIFLNHGFSTTF